MNICLNPHSTDIFYHLIILCGIPCGVQLDPRQRFTICTYQNEADCLHLLYISNFTLFTWHIIWMKIRKVPLQHPWATFLSYKQKMKWPSEPNEEDIQYPITSLIFVIESQTLCLCPCFQGQGSQFLPPARFWKWREVLFWVPSPSPPSPRMFCLISRLLLKLAFWNLACAIYAKTILLKCF